ncbi:hypothetical protein [Streptomyces sp. CA-251251]|uniref:hypothetical protein n=1 Tax=Streptomyces sp. CA-251251 TaxID=3240063 RepID=UPI003D921597
MSWKDLEHREELSVPNLAGHGFRHGAGLLGAGLRRHEEEHGHFSEAELAEARSKIFGATGTSTDADAA